eukprot:NODE_2835_length_1331_cov_44.716887_g2693_i0.p1 GENE.NODE_2835_length_1331_cov_44.716887_g2693_i0~~NODE_2835_length_1331_cov_44.716887_g2693_i0.p1  ORF type:complete len:383 (+),score=51.83 NODE_2835_length_1331_cov_44.716887_g2693_i0:87-1235(+)
MKIAPFKTEEFFALYEFNTTHQLCCSDCESITIKELFDMAGVGLEELGNVSLSYSETTGSLGLRKAISGIYDSVKPEEVVMLGAPVEGIYLAANALLSKGDEVIVMTPAYDALVTTFEHVVGIEATRPWPLRPVDGAWQLDLESLKALATPNTKLVVVNFPHNPTGFVPTSDELRQIQDFCSERGVWLFCDEIYAGLTWGSHQAPASVSDNLEYTRTITLRGLSKTYGLPGLRSGWLVVKDEELRNDIINWKFYTTICGPTPVECITEVALKVHKQLAIINSTLVEENVKIANAFFSRHSEKFEWRPPMGGSVGLVRMKGAAITTFAHQMAKDAGILILPATCMGGNDQDFRMGFGRKNFAEALQKFEDYLSTHSPCSGGAV